MVRITQLGRFQLDLAKPQIMGIVNITPDSFSDGGLHSEHKTAIAHAWQLIEDGANILDLGAESTRPGAQPVSAEEELRRLVPVIRELLQAGVPLSIDTFKPQVMAACLDLGADIINDIYALRQTGAPEVLARYPQAAVILMHMHGHPKTMQLAPPDYGGDVTGSVACFLQERLDAAHDAGICKNRIILDPGFGFGKTVDQNYKLLQQLADLQSMQLPILAGMSRKSMLGAVTGSGVAERGPETIAAHLAALSRGASILRVHDVSAMNRAVQIWQTINKGKHDGS